jgi:hypothetical protein
MLQVTRWMLAVGSIGLAFVFSAATAAEKDEMVDNPIYKYWSKFHPGATVTRLEKTVYGGPEKNMFPDGIDEKTVKYTLISVTPEAVTTQVVVSEPGFLSTVESAPTKQTSAKMIKKSHLRAGLHDIDPMVGKDTIKVLGKEMECTTLSGTEKKGGEEVEHKVWVSDKVPGGIVKHTRVTKQDGKLIADTTITLKSFQANAFKKQANE